MAKGKKKGKTRKQRLKENQKFRNMSADQLISKGDACIKNSNIRDAVTAYKQAEINKAAPEIVIPKLFHAYSLRYKQLKDQKMAKEAETILNTGVNIFSRMSVITSDVLSDCILFFPVQKCIEIYKTHMETNDPLPDFEKKLANRLVADDCLHLARDLDNGSRLKSDLGCIQPAITKMEGGDWEEALRETKTVSRKSPYFDLKVFAKAMVSYLKDDKKSLEKALCMLDSDFPSSAVSILLKKYAVNARFDSPEKYPKTAALLLGETIHKKTYQLNLEKAVDSGNIKSINKWARALSEILLPDRPEKAMVSILELIGSGELQTKTNKDKLQKLLKNNISSEALRNRLFVKILSVNRHFLSFYTLQYLETIEEEFPDKEDRQIAESILLMEVIKALDRNPDLAFDFEEDLKDIFYFFNMPDAVLDEDIEQIIFEIAQKAIDLDPENREAYDIIMDLPVQSPGMRKAMEPLLLKRVEVFSKDHIACLKLADLYYLKNAFRKAENILLEAYTRSPHDLQVREKYALSFIIAGVRNLKRKKWNIVNKDLEKAEKFNLNSLKIFIAEKKLFSHTVKNNKFSRKLFETLTREFSLHETMKALLLFMLDMEDPDNIKPGTPRGVATVFKSLEKNLKALSSNELYSLIKPVKKTFTLLFQKSFFAGPVIKEKVLSRLNNDDFTNLIMDLVENDFMALVIKELKKRKKTAEANPLIILDFYYEALCCIQGNKTNPERFEDIINKADGPLKERLRKISRQLSGIAPYHVKEAFETFNFQLLNSAGFPYYDFLEDDADMMPDQEIIADIINDFFKKTPQKNSDFFEDPEIPEKPEIDLGNFKAKNIFGKKCNENSFNAAVIDLAGSADLLVNTSTSYRHEIMDMFIDDFSQLISLIRKTDMKSVNDFRQTGRKFATELAYAKTIVQALDICKAGISELSSREVQHFIMGMRTGI